MTILAALIALVLFSLAGLHVYWAHGGVWPGKDQATCARAVAGFEGIDRMPPLAACYGVAGVLTVGGLLALALAGIVSLPLPRQLLTAMAIMAAIVFFGRGIAGFTPAWRRLTPEQPFATNDARYFSPLCLALGAGFALLVYQGA